MLNIEGLYCLVFRVEIRYILKIAVPYCHNSIIRLSIEALIAVILMKRDAVC